MPISIYPSKLVEGVAAANMRDVADIYRNDGAGWVLMGRVRCNIRYTASQANPDPTQATAAEAEIIAVSLPRRIGVRIGDQVRANGRQWTVTSANDRATHAASVRVTAQRPTAATVRQTVQFRRINAQTGNRELVPPQQVQIVLASTQPGQAGGANLIMSGWLFAPEGAAPLDVQMGDTFLYGTTEARVTWVSMDPTDRREATFSFTVGEGW